jgi:hypothetical protein
MKSWISGYWRVYNVLVRVFGVAALVSGVAFIGWGVLLILRQGVGPLNDTPGLIPVVAGLLAAGLGGTILGTPTYRPDLGDAAWNFDPFGQQARKSTTANRSWWTGDK